MSNATVRNDLRSYLDLLQESGELRHVGGADWNLELGAITEVVSERQGPALLFDEIKDYPKGFRVVTNVLRSTRRLAMAVGLPPDMHGLELLKLWRGKTKTLAPTPPIEVADGPVLENRLTGAGVDLERLPAPKWHEEDGGRYLGTGCCVITVDPDSGRSNLGTYRCMIQGRDEISIKMNKGKHGRMAMEKYHARGKACPVAVSLGHAPSLLLASILSLPKDVEEYQIAGSLSGSPVEILRSPIHGLPIPANAEIVIEGEIPPLSEIALPKEGPFGEWPGYYADTTVGEVPLMRVKAIYHRNNPILFGMPPLKPPNHYVSLPLGAAGLWDQLEAAGVPNVTGVWSFVYGGVVGPFVVISIEQAYAGHAQQTLAAACGTRAGAYGGKFVVVVDSDVDITDLHEVIWAMSTRCDPSTEVQFMRNVWTSPADPAIPPATRHMKEGVTTLRHGYRMDRVLINACRPYEWFTDFPKVNAFPRDFKAEISRKWDL